MQITKNSTDTTAGPSDWFTGSVFIDTVAAPSHGSRLAASSVHFTPGAHTAWHTHPHGQTIWVTEGVGLCQRRGGPIAVIRPGDRVFFEPGVVASLPFITGVSDQKKHMSTNGEQRETPALAGYETRLLATRLGQKGGSGCSTSISAALACRSVGSLWAP
jgi:quercetin dioxygenase-like cupin family protein